jgi:hypothetical protein
MNFEKKIEVFKEICKRELFDEKKINEVFQCMKRVQKIRNDFAHQIVAIDPNEKKVYFGNRRKSQFIILESEKVLKEVEEDRKKSVEMIIEFYSKYYNDGTIDEKIDKEAAELIRKARKEETKT